MTTDFNTQLDELRNQTFKSENQTYQFISWRKNGDKFILETDRRTFVLFKHELEELLRTIELVKNSKPFVASSPGNKTENTESKNLPTTSNKISLDIYEPNDTQKELQKSLLNALEKVQLDPKYIPQAKSVCEIANTLINIEKNQINMMNAAKRSIRSR